VGIQDKLTQLAKATEGALEHFQLESGELFWFGREETSIQLFLWGCDCACADTVEERPEPPPVIEALVQAKDRRSALHKVYPSMATEHPATFVMVPFDIDAFLERGELVHRSLVAGRELDDEPVDDLSSQHQQSLEQP
jgi:hypothetical protein